MYATIRRYEGIDKTRSEEITRKASETLAPKISELSGFAGYFLIDAGEGVFTSVGLFENADTAHESTRLAATWVLEEKLQSALPNPPKMTAGPVVADVWKTDAVATGILTPA